MILVSLIIFEEGSPRITFLSSSHLIMPPVLDMLDPINISVTTTAGTRHGDTTNGDAPPFTQMTGVMMNGNRISLINTYVSYIVQSSSIITH